jgi:hypothetical protein
MRPKIAKYVLDRGWRELEAPNVFVSPDNTFTLHAMLPWRIINLRREDSVYDRLGETYAEFVVAFLEVAV